MDDKKDFYIVCIVSIVAIIGIIVLVLANGGISGQASKKIEALPGTVELVAPANGAVNVPLYQAFDWTASHKADFVVLYLDDEPGFSTPLIQEFQLRKNMKSYVIPTGILQPGKTYYWLVVAYNNAGASSSQKYSFTTAP